MTEITTSYRKKYRIVKSLNWLLCYGLAVFMIVFAIASYSTPDSKLMEDLTVKFGTVPMGYVEKLKSIAISAAVSFIPMVILSIVVKDKIRPLVWMINILLSNILIGETMMYIVFAIWLFFSIEIDIEPVKFFKVLIEPSGFKSSFSLSFLS